MTYTPKPDLETVMNASGITGWDGHFFNRIPDPYESSTTGGGTVNVAITGTDVYAGSTAGDEAQIRGPNLPANNANIYGQNYALITVFAIDNGQTLPYSDEVRVGSKWDIPDITDTRGVFLDLTNEDVVVNGVTEPLPTSPNSGKTFIFYAFHEAQADETYVVLQGTNYYETLTVSGSPSRTGIPIQMASNGNDDQIRLEYHRQVLFPNL